MTTHPTSLAATRRTLLLLFRCTACLALGILIAGCPQSEVAGQVQPSDVAPPSGACGADPDCTSPPGGGDPSNAKPTPGPTTATITAVNLGKTALQQVPMTFGEPFRAGDIPKGNTIVAYQGGKALPTQADVKARNPDGSVRHAILTVQVPSLASGASQSLDLRPVAQTDDAAGTSLTLQDVLLSGFDATVTLKIAGQPWHLDARELLQHAQLTQSCETYGKECSHWLSGPLASEWIVGGPVLNAQGVAHPHLAVYFAVRAYGPAPVSRVRVDVIVEDDWAYAPDPQNVTYDATIQVPGQPTYTLDHLEHYRQARWHKTFWWGQPDPVYARQDSKYLQSTLAVPRYQDITISDKTLEDAMQRVKANCGPMKNCDQTKNMATAGAQPGIGPLPRWTSAYVVDPTHQAYVWMLANNDALGSYDVHYRDQSTGQPVSVDTHPCATLVDAAETSSCPVPPHANDNFPDCNTQCNSPWGSNEAHHPAPAYVAYLVTGDWYYLEELKFWADWIVFQRNPSYRDYRTGYLGGSPRGVAWGLRTLGYAAYILPDHDPFKTYFNEVVENNIQRLNGWYTDNPSANKLHIVTFGTSIPYPNQGNPNTGIATWQASFFTWSVGNLKDLGFTGADRLLDWLAAFQVNLMTSPDYCWIVASGYELQVRDTEDSPIYESLGKVYANTYPYLQGIQCNSDEMAAVITEHRSGNYQHVKGSMTGYPYSATGFPANFQIGLAAAADSGVPGGAKAWQIFSQATVRPDYTGSPQFAVIPRSVPGDDSP